MKVVWKLLWKYKLRRLANAIGLANSSQYFWHMHPVMRHPDQTNKYITSFFNGWYTKIDVRWTDEVPDSDPFYNAYKG